MGKTIFKDFDIRGVYPQEINEQIAAKIGFCAGKLIKGEKAIIGYDVREISQKMSSFLVSGLSQSGKKIVSLGQVPIEVFYYLVGKNKFDLGIYITGSHCAWSVSGFKLVKKEAIPFGGNRELEKLKKEFLKSDFQLQKLKPLAVSYFNWLSSYAEFVFQQIDFSDFKGKIQFFSFGGIAEKLASEISNKINLYWQIHSFNQEDLNNRPPNPLLPENQNLIKKQINPSVDLVVATDGDGDRTIFFDPQTKEMIPPDFIAALLARQILSQRKGPLVFDCSKKMAVAKVAKEKGVDYYLTKVGYPYIKAMMRAKSIQAVFGGEVSGHYFYPQNFYSESSILTIGLIWQYLKSHRLTLSQALEDFKNEIFSLPQENFKDIDFKKAKQELTKELSEITPYELDGLIFEAPNWYLCLRPSRTESVVRLNLEAKSKKILEEIYHRTKNALSRARKSA